MLAKIKSTFLIKKSVYIHNTTRRMKYNLPYFEKYFDQSGEEWRLWMSERERVFIASAAVLRREPRRQFDDTTMRRIAPP